MKKSLIAMILQLIILALFILSIQSPESDSILELDKEIHMLNIYKEKELNNLTDYLKKYEIADEIIPLSVELEANKEIVILAKEEIAVKN